MSLQPESFRVGRYQVLDLLGLGGMGEVYAASDPVLERRVAVKVLPERLRHDESMRRRFLTEARAIAALNHPNIVTIHEVATTTATDVGFAPGIPYLVMERIHGRSLLQVMHDRRLLVAESTSYALQILEGLKVAHKHGLIHRDIKPSNLMVTDEGRIKILDFGLSKLIRDETPMFKTGEGLVVGTVEYLSPEQALGKPLDQRSDLFAFGIVLFEMLAGEHPFEGRSATEMMANILTQPARRFPHDARVPETLTRVVDRALQKNVDVRYANADEAMRDVARVHHEITTASAVALPMPTTTTSAPRPLDMEHARTDVIRRPVDRRRVLRIAVPVCLGLLAGLAILAALRYRAKPAPLPQEILKPVQVTSGVGLDIHPSFSPDGNSLAYASDRTGIFEIYVRQLLAGGSELAITKDGAQNLQPAWSPDGRTIAYTSKRSGGIWIVPALGGTPRQLTTFGSKPAWAPDGTWIAFQSDPLVDLNSGAFPALPPSTIWAVSATGGEPRQLTRPGTPVGGHGSPTVSPDGSRVAFVTYVRPRSELWVVSKSGGTPVALSTSQAFYLDPVYAADGSAVYLCSAAPNVPSGAGLGLFRLALDPKTQAAAGKPVEIFNMGLAAIRQIAITRDGKKLAFSALITQSNLQAIPASGGEAKAVALTSGNARHSRPVFSPDGSKIAFCSWRTGANNDIWLMDRDGKGRTQLTSAPSNEDFPSWFPDGQKLAFLTTRNGPLSVYQLSVGGIGEELLADLGPETESARLSPDGTLLAYNSKKGGSTVNVWVATSRGQSPRQITFDKELAGFPCWSPDGKSLAIEVKRGEDTHVAVVGVDGGKLDLLTSERGIDWPWSFSPSGDEVAFAGFRDSYWNLFTVSRATRKERKLTSYERLNAYVRYPAISPSGDTVVYELAETTGNVWLAER